MSQIKASALELIGGTPLLRLNGYTKKAGITDVTLLANYPPRYSEEDRRDREWFTIPRS